MRKFLFILAALALVGCGEDYEPKAGDVVRDKMRTAAHTDSEYAGNTCYAYDGKTGMCTFSVPQYRDVYYPEAWWFVIGNCNAEKCEGGTFQVTEHIYEQFVVGDYWIAPEIHGAR